MDGVGAEFEGTRCNDKEPHRRLERDMPSFRSDDGLDIFYESWENGDGVPVVLHHGFAASGEIDWVQTGVVDALTAAGRRVIAIDARGHGRSDKPHDPSCSARPEWPATCSR